MLEDIPSLVSINTDEIKKFYQYNDLAAHDHLIKNPTDYYRVDKNSAYGYFGIFPQWREKIFNYLQSLSKECIKFTYVDVCGRASGKIFGASSSYLFSLKTTRMTRIFYGVDDIFVDGNIFEPSDFSKLLRIIKKGDIAPAFITFMPMAGLQSYTPSKRSGIPHHEALAYIYLGKRLSQLIRLLRPGGYLMMERPFQFDGSFVEAFLRVPQNKFKLSMAVKKIARKLKCKVEIVSGIGGPYFLIHKPIA